MSIEEEKERLIAKIVDIELDMFLSTPNEGGTSVCQTRPNSFRVMRWMNHCTHDTATLESYLEDLEEAVAALRPSGLKLAVHLNLVEGKALSPAAEIPLLVRPDGSFCNSFTGLLRLSLTPRRRAFAAQLYRELERQLLAYAALFPAGTPLRIDSHQHTHMIPLVFRTLLQILADHHLPVEHLRIPAEPLPPSMPSSRPC